VAIGTWSDSNARNLRQAAGIAVANGLPWAAAWRAVTTAPAGIYGLTARYGDVAPGMAANLVVWGGDPFEPATDVRAVVIGGRAMPLETRQDLLARKYRKLP
jgi:imidazolonepropionase-like amidohydrolase